MTIVLNMVVSGGFDRLNHREIELLRHPHIGGIKNEGAKMEKAKKKCGLLERANKVNHKKNAQFVVWSLICILFGFVFIAYDVILIIRSPGTFWDIVFSFTHIWSVLGLYLDFVGIYRLIKKHSFWRIWNKGLKLTTVCLFTFVSLLSLINLSFILRPVLGDENDSVDYVILLGGGIDKNGKLPESVEMRVKKAAEYLKKHENAICVVTGGTLDFLPYPEAPALKEYLVNQGIDSEKVLVEDMALDTIQNFQLSCKMLADFKGVSQEEILNSKVTIVTSYFHLRRAERLANRMGFKNIKGVASRIPLINIPHCYVREICSYIKLNLRILITGKPFPITEQF
ncbi:MAG: YdcF family protein [Treponema sp.]|nr:YdcF family protein [Treponema sp.]